MNRIVLESGVTHELTQEEFKVLRIALSSVDSQTLAAYPNNEELRAALEHLKELFTHYVD